MLRYACVHNGEEKAGVLRPTTKERLAQTAHNKVPYAQLPGWDPVGDREVAQVRPAATEQNAEAASGTQNNVEQTASSYLETGPNKNDLVIGKAVIKWFQKANLQEDHPILPTMRGAFVEGKIIEVEKKKNGTQYKLAFDVLTLGENWYS
jgi:hypothetical protein